MCKPIVYNTDTIYLYLSALFIHAMLVQLTLAIYLLTYLLIT